MVVAHATTENVTVLFGTGGGDFVNGLSVPIDGAIRVLEFGDVTGNGVAEAVYVSGNRRHVTVAEVQIDGTLSTLQQLPLTFATSEIALEDLNDDGLADLLFASDGNTVLRLADGTGGFGDAIGYQNFLRTVQHVAAGDMDGDGDVDIVTHNDAAYMVRFNDGNGDFSARADFEYPQVSIADFELADLDDDGDLDVVGFGFNSARGPQPFLNDGSGNLTEGEFILAYRNAGNISPVTDLVVNDFNSDGFPDAIGSFSDDGFQVFLGDRSGTFKANASKNISLPNSLLSPPRLADVNGDDHLDIVSYTRTEADGTFHVSLGTVTARFRRISLSPQ